MYTSFFGLTEKPFAITPDPRYLYLSDRHAEALAHLVYGITHSGGFIQLTGEVGTGKTTVVRSLLAQVPENADIALILNPRVSPLEFLQSICDELRLSLSDTARCSIKYLVDQLNDYLLAQHALGRRVVVIVDEAQQLSPEVLEQVRLLTNLETATTKLLQIILIGQPELRELLARTDLRQLAQRITGRYHLEPLLREETCAYVRHRLKVAGAIGPLFTTAALHEVHRLARGTPRVINVLCDRALLAAFTQEQHRVEPALVRVAASEVSGRRVVPAWVPWTAVVGAVVVTALVALALWSGLRPATNAASHAAPNAPAANTLHLTTTGATDAAAADQQRGADTNDGAADSPPAVSSLLAAHAAETGTDTAMVRLFARWGLRYDPQQGAPCPQASSSGLECATLTNNWAQLLQLNRPAVLSLADAAGNEHQVLLLSVAAGQAQLALGSDTAGMTVSLPDLERHWFGQALLLWRPAFQPVRTLSQGMRGAEVRSLQELLRQAAGHTDRQPLTDHYDGAMLRDVQAFQRQHHLTPDGIAGVRTQMVLDAVTGTQDVPLLNGLPNRPLRTTAGEH
jgi:general secretion pathway protein A